MTEKPFIWFKGKRTDGADCFFGFVMVDGRQIIAMSLSRPEGISPAAALPEEMRQRSFVADVPPDLAKRALLLSPYRHSELLRDDA